MLNLFDFILKVKGFPIQKAEKDLHKILNLNAFEFEKYLSETKNEIVNYHLQNNSFYQSLVGNNWNGDWNSLPILNKKNLQKPLSERLSNGFENKNIYINKTSGSSGDPFVFAKDKYAHALTWASNKYRFGLFGIDFNHSYQARFYGIPLDFMGNTKERIKDFFSHRYRFPIFDLSDEVLAQFLLKFKTKKFDYINGYTSSIVLFAKYLKQKNIVLKNVCPTLKYCFVTSEMLFEEDKILLENQFQIPIINEYGASELDLIAFENPNNEWQVNAETLFVEILDDNNNVLPYGEVGRVVITALFNKAHPFIRYEIGDLGVLSKKSTAQKPILEKLVGRTNDIALLPSGKKSPGLTFYYITKSIIEDDGNVKEFIIKQTKTDQFIIEYVAEIELNTNQKNEIQKAIIQYLEPNLSFEFVKKEALNRSKRGKLKQFERLFS